MEVLRTERLVLRRLSPEDAAFILELVNDPDWLRYIGDRGVRTLEEARDYLARGPIAMYAEHGFGLYRVELRESGTPIGICGPLRREGLDDADLGFAFLPRHRGRGYAHEAAAATLEHARDALRLARVVAIVSPENRVSIQLLLKLGFARQGSVRLAPGAAEAWLFARSLRAS